MHVKAEAQVQHMLSSTICKPLPLMLPAPVEMPMFIGINTLDMIRATDCVRVSRAA
jgi:hypothetical protein